MKRVLGLRECAATLAVALSLGLGAASPGQAQDFELAAAPQPVSGTDTIEITLHADGTAEEVRTRRVKILTETGLKSEAKQAIGYQSTLQDLSVLEAYTEKADGRRIDVDRPAIVTRDLTIGEVDVHDQKIRLIIFPDVAVGDTVVLAVRRDIKPILPGQFSETFAPGNFITDTLRVTAPKDLWLNVASYGNGYDHQVAQDDNTVTHTLTHPPMANTVVRPNEPGAIAPADRDVPHIVVTTYKDYWMLGRNAWAAAKSRIESTPEIIALANEITSGIGDRRAQAEAIDSWVKGNIRYVAIEIGAGGLVPHQASEILKIRYGDCKDHATLLAALLAAKDIASELVLIHVGNSYALPEAANPGAFNHMIVYIPELQLYDDPTAQTAAFGVLAAQTYDQPVLRISAQEIWVGRTPAMRAVDHVSINRTKIMIAADGTVSGETTETTTGIFAASARARAADILNNKGADDAATETLLNNGNPGTGLYEIEHKPGLAEPFVLKAHFVLDRVKLTPGASYLAPIGLALMPRPGVVLLGARQQGRRLPFMCMSGRQVEEIELTFAEGLPLPKPIPARKISTAVLTYVASAELTDRTLTIRREYVAHVSGQVCAAALETDIARATQDVVASLRTAVTFAPPPASTPMTEKAPSGEKQASASEPRPQVN